MKINLIFIIDNWMEKMKTEPKYKRGDKIYLDEHQKTESQVNLYLGCRDGIVKMYEYNDCSGYGNKTRLYYCQDTKHEHVSIIRQTLADKLWQEEVMSFDTDSFQFLEGLLNGDFSVLGGKYELLRDY